MENAVNEYFKSCRGELILNKIGLVDFFQSLNYDWRKDEEVLKKICYYTKTRSNLDKECLLEEFKLAWGMEQPLILKAIGESVGAKNFLEIGTGRGTACYMVSTIPTINNIKSFDIIHPHEKQQTAIGYKPTIISNSAIYDQISLGSKYKIYMAKRSSEEVKKLKRDYDLCFIDGDHDNISVIREDFELCLKHLTKDGVIVFDDYDPDKFKVKLVCDELDRDPNWDLTLVSFRGHLFHDKKPEVGSGMVVARRI